MWWYAAIAGLFLLLLVIHYLNILIFFVSHCWWTSRLFPIEILKILLLWTFWYVLFKYKSAYLEELLDHRELVCFILVDIMKQLSKLVVSIMASMAVFESISSCMAFANIWCYQFFLFSMTTIIGKWWYHYGLNYYCSDK